MAGLDLVWWGWHLTLYSATQHHQRIPLVPHPPPRWRFIVTGGWGHCGYQWHCTQSRCQGYVGYRRHSGNCLGKQGAGGWHQFGMTRMTSSGASAWFAFATIEYPPPLHPMEARAHGVDRRQRSFQLCRGPQQSPRPCHFSPLGHHQP